MVNTIGKMKVVAGTVYRKKILWKVVSYYDNKLIDDNNGKFFDSRRDAYNSWYKNWYKTHPKPISKRTRKSVWLII
jgi:hypothetical protein